MKVELSTPNNNGILTVTQIWERGKPWWSSCKREFTYKDYETGEMKTGIEADPLDLGQLRRDCVISAADFFRTGQVAGRFAGFHVRGLQLANSIADDASNVGRNASSLVAPGGTAAYKYFAPEGTRGTYLADSYGATFGGEPMVFAGGTSGWRGSGIGAIRAKDGAVISKTSCNWATPVVQGNMIYTLRSLGVGDGAPGIELLDIARIDPDKLEQVKTVTMDNLKFFRIPRLEINLASPLYHDGLVYIVDADGLLTVVDVEKYEIVYQKLLDMDNGPGGPARGVQGASPALGGKYIYAFGNHGTCVVFEPGRQYRQVAKNRIESFCNKCTEKTVSWHSIYSTQLEQTLAGPVFDGDRMYYRGLINLYCIEEKK